MNLKRFGLALVAVAMLAAITAGSASAAGAVTPTESRWIIGGTKMADGGSETVKCKVGKHLFGANREAKLELTGSLGENLVPVKLTATGVECINPAGTGGNGTATINQRAAAGGVGAMAEDEGRLRFTGVTVDEPANCQVKGISIADPVGTVTTLNLKTFLQEETTATPKAVFDKFQPATGTVFVEIEISKSGTLACGAIGKFAAKGFSYGEAVKNTEATEQELTTEEAREQALTFGKGIEETAIGTTGANGLTLGGNPAFITGRALNELSGAHVGEAWGAVEK